MEGESDLKHPPPLSQITVYATEIGSGRCDDGEKRLIVYSRKVSARTAMQSLIAADAVCCAAALSKY